MITILILFCAWLVAVLFYLRWRIRKGWNDDSKKYKDWYLPSEEDVIESWKNLENDNEILDWWEEHEDNRIRNGSKHPH